MSALSLTSEILSGSSVRIFQSHPDAEPLFIAKDLAAPLGVTEKRIRNLVAELAPEDKGACLTGTLGGAQKLNGIVYSAVLQVITQLRSPSAAALRKQVCDIYVRYTRGELATPDAKMTALEAKVDALQSALALFLDSQGKRLQPVGKALIWQRLYGKGELNQLTPATEIELKRDKYLRTSEYLTRQAGRKVPGGYISGLTRRCIRFSGLANVAVRRYLAAGSVLTYIREDVLKEVDSTNWRGGRATLSADQLGLFGVDATLDAARNYLNEDERR